MSIDVNTNRNDYVGAGNLDEYAYDFKIFNVSDLLVKTRSVAGLETTLIIDVDYTVANVGETDGGTITLLAGDLASNIALTILGRMSIEQENDIGNQGSFYPEVIEEEFDKLAMVDQQQQEQLSRSVRLADTIKIADFDPTIPTTLIGEESVVFGTNEDGDGFAVGPTFTEISNAQSYAIDSAASAAASLSSETAASVSAAAALVSRNAAAASETAADASAVAAAASVATVAASAAAALVSENAAAASAVTASTQATNAATSASNASTSAATASTQASNASTSATTASTQASNASTSAGNAFTSETNAAASAVTAAASAAAPVIVNDGTTNATMYPTWVTATGGNFPLKSSTGNLTYNPNTGNFTATTFSGALAGNATSATTATNATNAATTAVSNSATYYPLFVASSSNGNQAHNLGTGLTFNPSTNVLTTTNFTGAVTGTASGNTTYSANQYGVVLSGSGNAMTVIAPNVSTTKVLTSAGTGAAPTWQDPPTAASSSDGQSNLGLTASVAANALTIALKQADGTTDPSSGAAAVKISFRSATATSGAYNERSVTAALSIVVPSSATLGQASATSAYVWLYAMDNAGTVELAVSGVNVFEDYSIQSSTTIGAGSTSGTVLYSTTGRSNLPIRIIGRFLVSEATAGTWASAPTSVVLFPKPTKTITEPVTYALTIGAVTTPPTLGTNTSLAVWTRDGAYANITYALYESTNAGAAGSGFFKFPLPSGLVADTTYHTVSGNGSGAGASNLGPAHINLTTSASTNYSSMGSVVLFDTTNLAIDVIGTSAGQTTLVGSVAFNLSTAPVYYSFSARVKILGWSNYGP